MWFIGDSYSLESFKCLTCRHIKFFFIANFFKSNKKRNFLQEMNSAVGKLCNQQEKGRKTFRRDFLARFMGKLFSPLMSFLVIRINENVCSLMWSFMVKSKFQRQKTPALQPRNLLVLSQASALRHELIQKSCAKLIVFKQI